VDRVSLRRSVAFLCGPTLLDPPQQNGTTRKPGCPADFPDVDPRHGAFCGHRCCV